MIFITLSLLLCVSLASCQCPMGWVGFKEDCLYFSTTATSWSGAEASCRGKGAWLASDDNEGKHDFIQTAASILTNFKIYEWYIGGSDYSFEGQWRWLETGIALGPFSKWGQGYPNGTTTNNCLALKWEGQRLVWVDELCGQTIGKRATHHHPPQVKHNYICEKPNKASANSGSLIG